MAVTKPFHHCGLLNLLLLSFVCVVDAAKFHRCSRAADVLPLRFIFKRFWSTKGNFSFQDWSNRHLIHSWMGFITLGLLSVFKISFWSLVCAQAAQNLVVLSREDAGAEQIFRNDGVKLIQRLLQSKQEEVVLSALRTLVGLCTGHQSRVSVAVLCEVCH